MPRSLVPADPVRTPRGIFLRKLDLSRRLQDAADVHAQDGRPVLYDLYHELSVQAYTDAFATYRKGSK